jgi:hypothetical protein
VIPPAPYSPATQTISVVALQTYSFKITVQIQELALQVVSATSPNINLKDLSSGTGITVVGGTTLTVESVVTFAGQPVSTALVTAQFNGTMYNFTYTNGMYVLTLTMPNVQYESDLVISATYAGMTSNTVTLPVTVNQNTEALISQLESLVNSLSQNISSLTSTVNSLTSTVNSLKTSISTLNSSVAGLQGSVSTLNNEYTTLNSRVDALSGLSGTVDIALAVSIIAIIISIVVLILVFRKIS